MFDLDFFSFRLDDSTNAVFSDALDLPTAISLADFDGSAFFVFFNDFANEGSANELVIGSIDSLSIKAVHLPAALPLFAGGLGLLGLLAWRRRRV